MGLLAVAKPPPSEPLADINHALHIEAGLECSDCHTGVEVHARAGVPSIRICIDCHEDEEPEEMGPSGATANTLLIHDHIRREAEPWWPELYSLPDHVVFSHRRHVAIGEMDCAECHGAMERATTLPDRPVEWVLTMDGCMECHDDRGASNDCFACHK